MFEYNIRKYQKEDFDELIALVCDGFLQAGQYHPKTTKKYLDGFMEQDDVRNMEEYYFGRGGTLLVAVRDNKIIASLGITISKKVNTTGIVKRMSVAKELRGKGLAQRLMNELYAFAKEKGLKRLKLTCWETNYAGQALYSKNNFTPYKKTTSILEDEETREEVVLVFLEKFL